LFWGAAKLFSSIAALFYTPPGAQKYFKNDWGYWHLFNHSLVIFIFSWRNVYVRHIPIFKLGVLYFWVVGVLYILDINTLSDM
jgi:hypothetical protein